jgi:hypothetical protein
MFSWLGTSWRWVVSFTPLPLYPQGNSPRYPLYRKLGEPQSQSGISLGPGGNKKPRAGIFLFVKTSRAVQTSTYFAILWAPEPLTLDVNPTEAGLSTATIKNTWISIYASLYSVIMWLGIQTTWPLKCIEQGSIHDREQSQVDFGTQRSSHEFADQI